MLERFYRGRAGRQGPEGTGLGLPIARELAAQWGGSVTIANRAGGGARARLELPARAAPTPVGGPMRSLAHSPTVRWVAAGARRASRSRSPSA